ncbi:hypothetical protein SDC9_70327 [bioreactor metagenome]|uniref:RteC protein n=1 Tax=bioreactor metagenome TaxID=1076179 RepID=A0A644Y5X4_9ZZZZ
MHLKIRHPEQFPQPTQQAFKSDLHIIPKSKDLGIVGLAEIVVSLHLSGEITGTDGNPIPLIRLANAFEYIFNLGFGSIYNQKDAVFRRKPYNRTKMLDILRNIIIREDRKRNNR